MQVVSINIGKAKPVDPENSSSNISGIDKRPVSGSVRVNTLGLEGDTVCSTEHHGGPDQAVYLYGTEDYSWWENELGKEFSHGSFGENITLEGYSCKDTLVGDRISIGELILEVTAARIPCGNFATHMKDSTFAKRFRQAQLPGAYCRVIREGSISVGDDA